MQKIALLSPARRVRDAAADYAARTSLRKLEI
jgi:hypothetical protein